MGKEVDDSGVVGMKMVVGEENVIDVYVLVVVFVIMIDIEKKRKRVECFGMDFRIIEVDKCKLRVVRFSGGLKNGVVVGEVGVEVEKIGFVKVLFKVLFEVENVKRKVCVECFGGLLEEVIVKFKFF